VIPYLLLFLCGGNRIRAGRLSHNRFHIVMAGLVPAIHDLSRCTMNVDARDKPGHDEFDGHVRVAPCHAAAA